jgi:hypothetical protein
MNTSRLDCALARVLLLIVAVSGCEHDKANDSAAEAAGHDANEGTASFLATWRGPDAATEQRTRYALSKWQNGVVDHEPILLSTALIRPSKIRPAEISLASFDEDKDLFGFGVKENYTDGTERLEEYPVYAHLRQLGVVDMRESGDTLLNSSELRAKYIMRSTTPSTPTMPWGGSGR